MTEREVVEKLLAAGFIEYPSRKHRTFKHPDGRITRVPRHKGDLRKGTLQAIQRQTGIDLS